MSIVWTKPRAPVAYAFRGYNVTNLGRSYELLTHPVFGDRVRGRLEEVSAICSDALEKQVDLVELVQSQKETTLEKFGEAIGLIVAMELAQIQLLEEFFDIRYAQGRFAYGYSLGEITSLIAGGMLKLEQALAVPLAMSKDCAILARDVSMGVVFSRGPLLPMDVVQRLCLKINAQGKGIIGISSYLAPNSVLVLGQRDTVNRFRREIISITDNTVHVRKNQHRWPPLHTPILWEANISNRAAVMMHTIEVASESPSPDVISMVNGTTSYTDLTCRDTLMRWIDHPQKLWTVVYETLARGIETVVHVGPGPNIVPATFRRLSDNIAAQLRGRSLNKLGLRAVSGIARRQWLAALLPSKAALLKAPFVEHIILEDWLLAQKLP